MNRATGNPAGSFLSDFALPAVDGSTVRASDRVGRPYILLFVAPGCPFSLEVLEHLAGVERSGVDMPEIVTVCSDGLDAARSLAEQFGLQSTVAAQDEHELAHLMRVPMTPSAYSITERRTTAAPLAIGVEAVIALLPSVITPASSSSNNNDTSPRGTLLPDRTPALRRGVLPGVTIPNPALAALDGSPAYLSDYRGRHMLVLFWSPDCPHCDDLIDDVMSWAQSINGSAIVIVSRGTAEENAGLARTLSGQATVLLQEHRTASRQFDVYDFPSLLYVGADGRVLRNLARGPAAMRKSMAQIQGDMPVETRSARS
jgi:peroxiredoxin